MITSSRVSNEHRWRNPSHLALVVLMSSIGACGGGGGSSSPTAVTPVAATQPSAISANLVTSVPTIAFASADKKAAYDKLNAVRSTCGTGLLAYNAQLETAGQYHDDFVGANFAAHPDAYAHIENAAYPGFKGATPGDRIALAGYPANGGGGEDFTGSNNQATAQVDAIDALLGSVYHLQSIFGSGNYDVGIATAQLSGTTSSVTVLELAAKSTPLQDIGSADFVSYPCAGNAVKTSAFGVGRESPDPLPGHDYTTNPIGQPIYVRLRSGQTLVISGFTVTNTVGNVPVAQAALLTKANDPNNFLGINEAVFIPNGPLTIGATYSVTVTGTNNGTAFTKTFTFTTTA